MLLCQAPVRAALPSAFGQITALLSAASAAARRCAKYKTDGQTLVGSMQQVAKLSVLTCCVSVQTVSKEHGPSFTAVL